MFARRGKEPRTNVNVTGKGDVRWNFGELGHDDGRDFVGLTLAAFNAALLRTGKNANQLRGIDGVVVSEASGRQRDANVRDSRVGTGYTRTGRGGYVRQRSAGARASHK